MKHRTPVCRLVRPLPLITLLLIPGVARADLAPVVYEGLTLRPVRQTEVRMDSEYVEITLGPRFPDTYVYPAHVSARFFMVNDGADTLTVDVGFPVFEEFDIPGWHSDDVYQFQVSINGGDRFAPSAPGRRGEHGPFLWYGWTMRFVPGLTVVEVDYDIRSSYTKGCGLQVLEYALETGRSWKDAIGQATIRMVFPVTIEADMIMPRTSPGYSIEDNVMVWKFEDFEPERRDNIWVEFMPPDLHQEIHTIKRELASWPIEKQLVWDDFTARRHARLARIYLHLGGAGGRSSAYPDFNSQAEQYLRVIVYKAPGNAGAWNTLLSSYCRAHPDAFGLGAHVRGSFSDDLRALIAQAAESCPEDERIALWAHMADDSSWVLPDTLGYVSPKVSRDDYAFVRTLYDAVPPTAHSPMLLRNSVPLTPADHRRFVQLFRSWYLERAQREIDRLDRELGRWANEDGLIGGNP